MVIHPFTSTVCPNNLILHVCVKENTERKRNSVTTVTTGDQTSDAYSVKPGH